ncbi:DNA-directed RNA polymerase [Morchella snyderi]|nr:DNA-directed RNA polymerase [Morchella snyderi]
MASQSEYLQSAPTEDTPMEDLSEIGNDDPLVEEESIFGDLRITTLPGAEEGSASFEIKGEDHTLGNALRYIIMKNPEVEFCGYSIPHPSEEKMNIRIQIYPEYWETTKPYDVLLKGFDDLSNLCDHVTEAFTAAKDAHGKHEDK